MNFRMIFRAISTFTLMAALAGCMDVSMDVKVKNEAEATATMITTVDAQFYPMIKAQGATSSADAGDAAFCTGEDAGKLVENADGSGTCTITRDGKFADLTFDGGKETINFTPAGQGLVRVSLPAADFKTGPDAAGAGTASDDPQAKAAQAQMMQTMAASFAGHFLTLTIGGGEITDSNMAIAPDRQSAGEKIPVGDLVTGTAKLPAELYAVVKVK